MCQYSRYTQKSSKISFLNELQPCVYNLRLRISRNKFFLDFLKLERKVLLEPQTFFEKKIFRPIFKLFSYSIFRPTSIVVSNEFKYFSSMSDNLELLHYVWRRISSLLGLSVGSVWFVTSTLMRHRLILFKLTEILAAVLSGSSITFWGERLQKFQILYLKKYPNP